ncbi:MAG TPA: PAS domain-containing protein [Geobacteraceae bacterium]
MKRVCAWCRKELEAPCSEADHDEAITHGICKACADSFFSGTGTALRDFLETIGVPVVVADGSVTIGTANSAALALFRKELPDVAGNKGGDVFECIYAPLPGGCGATLHCSGCAIRSTVMDTYRTGKSHLRHPALLKRGRPDRPETIELLISTEKLGDVVLLRIDRIEPGHAGEGS